MRTYNKIKQLLQTVTLCAVVMQFNSCDSYLDQEPISQVSDATYWRDSNDLNSAIAGAYGQLRAALNAGLSYYSHGDLPTDYFSTESDLLWDYTSISEVKWGMSVAYTETDRPMYKVRDFTKFYAVIKQADLCLKYIPIIPEDEFDNYEAEYNQYTGEAYFLRAFAYFYMTRVWGDVPVVDSTDPDIVDLKDYAREDKDKVLIKVIEDCKMALEYLDWDTYNEDDKAVRANAGAAWALLAHAYAWGGNYEAAEMAANQVLESGYYSYIDREDDYLDIFDGQSVESIFEIAQGNETEARAAWYESLPFYLLRGEYLSTRENDNNTLWPFDLTTLKQNLFDDTNDYRRANGFAYFSTTSPVLLKYSKIIYTAPTSPLSTNNIVVFRLAGIALLKAEAQAAQGKYVEARATLNEIRNMSGLEDSEADNVDLFEAIIEERGRELFMEGHRFYDLVRLAREKQIYKFGDDSSNKIKPEEFELGKHYWPIQPTIIETNPLFSQTLYWQRELE